MPETSYDYTLLHRQADALLQGERDFIANCANLSALLFMALDDVNWVGFYLMRGNELVVGPFQGKPACTRIPLGSGVCGTAARSRTVQIVDDVHKFDGHIACDSASNSEIVLPMIRGGELVGVLDIDSPSFGRFAQRDADGLKPLIDALLALSD